MPRPEDFQGRVNYAAQIIASGRRTSRAFDGCFENSDGDEVCAVLLRRAENNPRLAANLWRYLSEETATAAAERLKDVSTRDMPDHAAKSRAKAQAVFEELMRKREQEQEAIKQRARDAGYTVQQIGKYEWQYTRPNGEKSPVYNHEGGAWHFAGLDAA